MLKECFREAGMIYIAGYFVIGFVLLLLTILVNNLFKLSLFYEDDPGEGRSRNFFEVGIILGWPLFGVIALVMALFLGVHSITGLLLKDNTRKIDPDYEEAKKALDKEFSGRGPE
jgi:hypothetical protein